MAISTVSSKGSIVIPLEIRRKFKIESGMKVNVISYNNTIRIVPIPKDPIKSLRGSLKFNKSALEMKREMRKEELKFDQNKWSRSGGK